MTDPFDFIAVDRETVCEFFAIFSRFEFALKECGYVVEGLDYAAPAWRRFAKECTLELPPESVVHVAIGYLETYPPEIQTPRLKWERKGFWGKDSTERAIESMTRVRNNLFHGGKSRPQSPEGRDQMLVEFSLMLLKKLLEQNANIRTEYEATAY